LYLETLFIPSALLAYVEKIWAFRRAESPGHAQRQQKQLLTTCYAQWQKEKQPHLRGCLLAALFFHKISSAVA